MKPVNQKAWFLVAPVLLLVSFTAIIPLMTVVNYSVQYVATNAQFHWVGDLWYREVLHSEKFWNALWRNLVFSGIILAIQIPLGVLIALNMPRKGWGVPACLVLMSLPLLIPWYVVGMIWQMFGRVDIGLMGVMLRDFGYNYEGDPMDAWFTLIIMDVWHWTSLVALLAYAGLVSIPNAYYQAARIDGASGWQVFLHVQLPRMARVLTIAVLLRFMDSFMIFTEPFAVIAGGDPVFLSTELSQTVELGQRAAMSIIYFLIILLLSWVFYTVMTRDDGEPIQPEERLMKQGRFAWVVPALYILFLMTPIYWLVAMSFKTNLEITTRFTLFPETFNLDNYVKVFSDERWRAVFSNSLIYVGLNTVISIAVALPAAYAFSRYRFFGDKHLFFWLLTNRMAPAAVFTLPFFQLYSAFGLFDTHIAVALAHCLFNVPLAVWILEGFMSGVPREIDETAYVDGHSFPSFFVKIFMPLIASGIGVAAFFCFMFSWVEYLIADSLARSAVLPITTRLQALSQASGTDWGVLAAAGSLTLIPGAIVIWFVRNYIAKGFALGRV